MSFPYSLSKAFPLKLVQEFSALKIQSAKLTGNGKKKQERFLFTTGLSEPRYTLMLADQLTLSQPGWQIMPTSLLIIPPDFQAFLQPSTTPGLSQAGGPGGPVPPHFLTSQLTLSQPGGAHYPHPVLCALPDFQTLRRPCLID